MFNQSRFEYLKQLSDSDLLSDSQRKEYISLLKQYKQQQTKKVLDNTDEL